MEKKEAVKIDKNLREALQNLKSEDGRPITWHLEKAVSNYLKAKKIALRGV